MVNSNADDINELVFGKSDRQRVVSIEPKDGLAELFIQGEDGKISKEFVPNKYWILSPTKLDKNFIQLKGQLHYKWGRQFTKRSEFSLNRNLYRKEDIYCIYDAKESLMVKDGHTYFKGMTLDELSVLSFDLETTSLKPEEDNAKILLISNTYRDKNGIERKLFCYDEFETQGEMIEAWTKWVIEKDPSVLLGHNILGFDLPYIRTIAEKENAQIILGRDGSEAQFDKYESQFRKEASQFIKYNKVKIYGREVVDTLFLSIKHDIAARKYTSYGLKSIIKEEGLEKKDRTFYDASLIRINYKNKEEWDKIKEYCKDDSDDSLTLFDLMVRPFFYMAQIIPKPFQTIIESASGSQLNNLMIRSYLQDAHSLPKASSQEVFEGAISEGNPGIYRNCFKVDVTSLYPSIILQYDVYDREKDPNSNLLRLVKYLTETRLQYKALFKKTNDPTYDALQGSFKILINSFYGFMGTKGLLFNSPANAAFITGKGREILNSAISWAQEKGFQIVNCDTDSITYCKIDHSEFTKDELNNNLKELNSKFPEKIKFEDDGYYNTVIVLKAKNYVLYDGKKIKIKGSALKASTKEPALKEFIAKFIDSILLNQNNFNDIYLDYIKEAQNVSDIKRWASRKTITESVLNPERTNEQKIADALEDEEYQPGDRRYFYFTKDGKLSLVENFKRDYDEYKLMQKVWNTAQIFSSIIDTKTFTKFHLKTKRHLLEELK
ncbi:hypothetical protein EBZ38_07560 [bacterium]|nr:hypothetical protein [bacterium]